MGGGEGVDGCEGVWVRERVDGCEGVRVCG